MYLESIFIGGDIRAQLPKEAKKFDKLDQQFKEVSTTGRCRADDKSGHLNIILLSPSFLCR